MVSKSTESGHPCLVSDLERKASTFSVERDGSGGFLIYGFDFIDVLYLLFECFNYEAMMNFI
jgi:hypothetical protein